MCAIYAQQLHQDGRAWRKVGLPEPGSSQTVSDVFSEYPFFVIYDFTLWPMTLVGFLGEARKIFDLFEKI